MPTATRQQRKSAQDNNNKFGKQVYDPTHPLARLSAPAVLEAVIRSR